jgi:GNAT superfamily N-acetyltransferase
VNEIELPVGMQLVRLAKAHPRAGFKSGQATVDEWIAKNALQNQSKHLSVTKVLLNEKGAIAGYYTVATGQVDFSDLPEELSKKLPRRLLPVAVLAWLGVDRNFHGQGLGRWLLASALRDCFIAGTTFAFIAVVLDCVDDNAKRFYQHFDFQELPGHPYRLYLSAAQLEALMTRPI